jgi:hypothetical protein
MPSLGVQRRKRPRLANTESLEILLPSAGICVPESWPEESGSVIVGFEVTLSYLTEFYVKFKDCLQSLQELIDQTGDRRIWPEKPRSPPRLATGVGANTAAKLGGKPPYSPKTVIRVSFIFRRQCFADICS